MSLNPKLVAKANQLITLKTASAAVSNRGAASAVAAPPVEREFTPAVPAQRLLSILGSAKKRSDHPDLVTAFREMTAATENASILTTVALKEVVIAKDHDIGSGEIYIVTSVLDGSGTGRVEYKTPIFEGINDGGSLPLGDGGLLIYFQKDPKHFIDLHGVIMESDSDVRELGALIEEAKKEAKLDEIQGLLRAMSTFDPTLISQAFSAVSIFLDVLVFFLKRNKDDHIATFHDFYLRQQLFGQGRHPQAGTTKFGEAELAYEITLSDF